MAVVSFGDKKGWDNVPFLLCNTPEGWKFDIVYKRKYIRMGPSPEWGIERTIFPYIELLEEFPYYTGQDMPLEAEDIFHLAEDAREGEMDYKLPEDF